MSSVENTWRLVVSDSADGPTNMGIDEAILESVTNGEAPATLRLYRWQPPTLSLGFAQPAADVDMHVVKDRGWGLVRRPTGGRAILHTDELTYALIAPAASRHVSGGVLASYQHLSQGLRRGLQLLGLEVEVRSEETMSAAQRANPVCFEVPSAYELMVAGKKVIGSAQLRRQGGVLQHGTFPLTGDIRRICQALHFDDPVSQAEAGERVAARAATASQLVGREVTWDEAAGAFRRGLEDGLGIEFEPADLIDAERQRAAELARRHRSKEWVFRV
jgi:lipoate-protein ligase A